MKALFIILKIILNILLFLFYWFISIISGDFLYGLILTIQELPVPGADDVMHMKIAILSLAFIWVVTLLLRKYFYFPVFSRREKQNEPKLKSDLELKVEKKLIEIKNKEEELEILVNKEIK